MLPIWLSRFIDRITRRHRRGTLLGDETLLDLQIRAYLRSEYANEIPSPGAFSKLMRAVQLHREEQRRSGETSIGERVTRNIRRLGPALSDLYHMFGSGDAARIISSGMVTALMLFALWPSIKPMLVNNYLAPSLNVSTSNDGSKSGDLAASEATQTVIQLVPLIDSPETSPSIVDEQRSLILPQRISQGVNAVTPSEDPNYLHPVERGFGKKSITHPTRDRPITGQD